MKKYVLFTIVAVFALILSGITIPKTAHALSLTPGQVPLYRFFNKTTGAHLYTINEGERLAVKANADQWRYEGVKYIVSPYEQGPLVPVYRFFNTINGAHLYTISESEKATIQNTLPHFRYEGIKFYVYDDAYQSTNPIHRFFNKVNGAHLYTDSETEKSYISANLSHLWSYEGIAYFADPSDYITYVSREGADFSFDYPKAWGNAEVTQSLDIICGGPARLETITVHTASEQNLSVSFSECGPGFGGDATESIHIADHYLTAKTGEVFHFSVDRYLNNSDHYLVWSVKEDNGAQIIISNSVLIEDYDLYVLELTDVIASLESNISGAYL